MQLAMEVRELAGTTVVSARGEIDFGSSPRFRDTILDHLASGRVTVLDLSEVEFLDSIGLGTIVAVLKRARSLGGDLALVVGRDRIRRPFELTGLTQVLTIGDDLATVVAATEVIPR
ncbi:MAG TPA: STAS domain-containing protein [Acidimicrobiales bacterium]|nr:STAS domain-containing protein [Acidimicrobiales bacterium]